MSYMPKYNLKLNTRQSPQQPTTNVFFLGHQFVSGAHLNVIILRRDSMWFGKKFNFGRPIHAKLASRLNQNLFTSAMDYFVSYLHAFFCSRKQIDNSLQITRSRNSANRFFRCDFQTLPSVHTSQTFSNIIFQPNFALKLHQGRLPVQISLLILII